MKVSEMIGKECKIDESYKGDFYYEFEYGGEFDYEFLDRNEWKGEIVSIGTGRSVNVVVVVKGEGVSKYFELESGEVFVDGECLDDVVDVWDWENVKDEYKYEDEDGMIGGL